MRDDELQVIRDRAETASAGPLEVLPGTATIVRHVSPQQGNIEHIATVSRWGTTGCDREADALLFAHARADILALLAEVARLRDYEAGYNRLLLVEAQCEAEIDELKARLAGTIGHTSETIVASWREYVACLQGGDIRAVSATDILCSRAVQEGSTRR